MMLLDRAIRLRLIREFSVDFLPILECDTGRDPRRPLGRSTDKSGSQCCQLLAVTPVNQQHVRNAVGMGAGGCSWHQRQHSCMCMCSFVSCSF